MGWLHRDMEWSNVYASRQVWMLAYHHLRGLELVKRSDIKHAGVGRLTHQVWDRGTGTLYIK